MSTHSLPMTRLSLLAVLIPLTLASCATREFVQQEVGGVNKRIDELSALLSTANQRIDESSGRIGAAEVRISNAEQVAAYLSRRIEQAQTGLADADKRIEDVSGRLQVADRRIATNSAEISRAHERLDGLETKLSATNDRVEGTALRITEAESGIVSLQSALRDTPRPTAAAIAHTPPPAIEPPSTAAEMVRPQPTMGEANRRLDEIAAEIASARQRIDTNATALDAAAERLTRVETQLDETRVQVERNEAGLTAAQRRIDVTQSQLTAAEQRIQSNTVAIASVGQRADTVQQGLDKAAGRLDQGEAALKAHRERLDQVQSALEVHDERLTRHDGTLAAVDNKIVQVQTALQQQEERLTRNEAEDAKISATAREALERAISAGKLAEGKLVYETALSETFLGFRLNQAKLSPEARQALKALADKLLAENRNVFIEIQGHTDNLGPADFNHRLGLQRAEVVRDFLQQAGIPLHRLSAISYGPRMPIASNATREGRSKNRRVVVVVLN